jgi:hypothetical protein
MTGTYHHQQLLVRMATLRGRPRYYHASGLDWERVLSLMVGTDFESGLIHLMLAVDHLIDGQSPESESIAIYPFEQQVEALEDAGRVAVELGYRLRAATTRVGWQWIDPAVVVAPQRQDDLVIGG